MRCRRHHAYVSWWPPLCSMCPASGTLPPSSPTWRPHAHSPLPPSPPPPPTPVRRLVTRVSALPNGTALFTSTNVPAGECCGCRLAAALLAWLLQGLLPSNHPPPPATTCCPPFSLAVATPAPRTLPPSKPHPPMLAATSPASPSPAVYSRNGDRLSAIMSALFSTRQPETKVRRPRSVDSPCSPLLRKGAPHHGCWSRGRGADLGCHPAPNPTLSAPHHPHSHCSL